MLQSVQIARYIISFSWIYHGIFPKIVQIAPLEMLMSSSAGLSEEATYFLIKSAGVIEISWGALFFALYKSRTVLYLNITALIGLLAAVAVMQPQLLMEAFNPVTTNIPLIALSFIILKEISASVDNI